MAIPVVTCGSDIVQNYSAGTYTESLSATATNSPTSFSWELVGYPTGSTALSETRGNFVNGVATIQNPQFVTDAGLAGSYVFHCTATNADGSSVVRSDKESAQQVIAVKTNALGLTLPSDYQWDWADENNGNLTLLETSASTTASHASTHQNGNSDEISVTGLSGLLADGQTPLAHATNHHAAGSDPIDHTQIAGSGVNTHAQIDTHISNTSNPHSVDKTDVSLSNVENLKVSLANAVAPGVGDDSDDDYAVGSRWIDTTANKEYVCLDSSVGAAVWTETTSAGGGAGSDTTAIHDNTAGEINAISAKTTLSGVDIVVVEDSEDSWNKKKSTLFNLAGGIKLDDLYTPDDNTDLNATTAFHGLLPKLSGNSGQALLGDGTWGTAGTSSPLSTKGDLYTYDTDNARIGIGSDGQVLIADSSETTGLKWEKPYIVADGVDATIATLASNQTVSATSYSSIPSTPVTLSFDGEVGETVILSFGAQWSSASSIAYFKLELDSVEIGREKRYQNATGAVSDCFPFVMTSSGSHTLELVAKVNSGSALVNAAGTEIRAHRIQGGYQQVDNVPILEYNSASVVNVTAGSGASGELRLQLSDGAQYTATSPLTVDMTVSGLGGLDTGAEASSTWYYVYAVQSATAGVFDVVCSVTDPDTGPTGYTQWKYLGAFFNDTSSNIRSFVQGPGGRFHYDEEDGEQEIYTLSASTPGTASWTQIAAATVAKAVPIAVAGTAVVSGYMKSTSTSDSHIVYIEPGNPPGFTPSSPGRAFLATETGSGNTDRNSNTKNMPMTDGTISHYWTASTGTVNLNIVILGYTDKYLSANIAQAIIPVRHLGEAYISSSATTTTVQTPTWTTLAGTFADGELQDFTRSSGVLTYTGSATKKFRVEAAISGTVDTADILYFTLSKEGTPVAKTEQRRYIAASNAMGEITLLGIIELANTDTIEIEVTRESAAAVDFTATKALLMVTEV